MYKYSASEKGFFLPEIHDVIPEDAVDVSEQEHEDLLAGQSAGLAITADDDGRPVLTEPVLPAPSWDVLRLQRDRLIAQSDWLSARHADEVALGITPTLSPEEYGAVLEYRQALRALPETYPDPADVIWPILPVFA